MVTTAELERAKGNVIKAKRKLLELEQTLRNGGKVSDIELARARALVGQARMEYLNKKQEMDSPEMC